MGGRRGRSNSPEEASSGWALPCQGVRGVLEKSSPPECCMAWGMVGGSRILFVFLFGEVLWDSPPFWLAPIAKSPGLILCSSSVCVGGGTLGSAVLTRISSILVGKSVEHKSSQNWLAWRTKCSYTPWESFAPLKTTPTPTRRKICVSADYLIYLVIPYISL